MREEEICRCGYIPEDCECGHTKLQPAEDKTLCRADCDSHTKQLEFSPELPDDSAQLSLPLPHPFNRRTQTHSILLASIAMMPFTASKEAV